MWNVFKDDELIFSGSATKVSDYLGVHRSTIARLKNGTTKNIPRHIDCDYLEMNGNIYTKKELVDRNDRTIDFGFGSVINIKGNVYEVTKIEQRENDIIYTFNNDFKMRALKPYDNYNSVYIALTRRLKRVVSKRIQTESRKEDNLVQNKRNE